MDFQVEVGAFSGSSSRARKARRVRADSRLMSGLSLQYLRVTVDVPQSIVDQE